MNQWRKNVVQWRIGDTDYLSVVFSWDLQKALDMQKASKRKVIIGGPAAKLAGMDIPELPYPVLPFHNPLATFTTRGCPNRCGFCAVPDLEGDLVELPSWEIKPVVCDNNLLAASRHHFDKVIDSLKPLPYVDFNQGLDASLFTDYRASRLAELQRVKIRFAFDSLSDEAITIDAIRKARHYGFRDVGVYILIGYKDNPENAKYRLGLIQKLGIRPTPMRFQPLRCSVKNSFVEDSWTEVELANMMKYYSRLIYYEHIGYTNFKWRERAQDRLWVR